MVKLLVAGALLASSVSGLRLSGDDIRKKKTSCRMARNVGQEDHWLTLLDKSVPGAGVDLGALKPFESAYKDGYSYVNCMSEGMRKYADLHEDPNAYGAQNVNVSVVWYSTMIQPEDRKDMTHDVCFSFCRSLENMNFFGILNAKECYCMPYYKQDVGGEDSICDSACEGNPAQMCGGLAKTSVFEMHMCADTKSELSEAIAKVSLLQGQIQMEVSNLGVCSSSMQYVGSSTQLYGNKAGDKFMGDFGQGYKVKAGEQDAMIRSGIKSYIDLGNMEKELQLMVDEDFSDAKSVDKADGLVNDAMTMVTKYTPLLKKVTKIMKECSGQLGFGHEERMDQYFHVAKWIDNDLWKAKNNSIDAICEEKDKNFLGMFIGDRRDCAYRCDKTLHPKKCVGFQHFNVLSSSQEIPSGVPLKRDDTEGFDNILTYQTPKGVMSLRGGPETFTMKNDKPSPKDAGKYYASDNYLNARVKAGYKMKLKMPEGSCYKFSLRMYDANYNRYELYTQKAWTSSTMPCGEVRWYNGANGTTDVMSIKEATSREYFVSSESDEVYASMYFNLYGDHTAGEVEIDFSQIHEQAELVGVCQLFSEPETISYYTCPEDMPSHKKAGDFAGCFLKFSEAKGFEMAKRKIDKNERCLITEKMEIPELKEFKFSEALAAASL